ncbi:MAG: hypothetical protein CMJ31_09780 [Phycisphaerae bacterium]|nr:hypothetical protein [Phycisphaerae bacterium]
MSTDRRGAWLNPTSWLLAAAAWVLFVGVALTAFVLVTPNDADAEDSFSDAFAATESVAWPAAFGPPTADWTCVVAVHPNCPCMGATLDALEAAVASAPAAPRLIATVYRPSGADASFTDTPTVGRLGRSFDAWMFDDVNGTVGASLGAELSGHVVVFDGDGIARFGGGLTPERGRGGANAGLDAVTTLLSGGKPEVGGFRVFGCPYVAPMDTCAVECER